MRTNLKERSLTFYICAPVKYETINYIVEKLENIIRSFGYKTWNPKRDAGLITQKDWLSGKWREILMKDIEYIEKCDGLIAILDFPSIGTMVELGYAFYYARNINKKYIIIGLYTHRKGKEELDSMLRLLFEEIPYGYIVNSFEELKNLLENLRRENLW